MKIRYTLFIAAAFFIISPAALALEGKAKQEMFTGALSKHKVYYDIYLPAEYSKGSQRFPVIYFLHDKSQGA
ncbi:MAG: hypothetical protein NE327_14680 [Lentisphaeraceae bacterium]|nr:hypothetical protein [Lentisphaeraceae bacterium]